MNAPINAGKIKNIGKTAHQIKPAVVFSQLLFSFDAPCCAGLICVHRRSSAV